MKMVDPEGHALGRQYVCSKEGTELDSDAIIRAHKTGGGEMVVVTDEELENIAPDKSRDIDLRRFVPLDQIPATHFERPYFMVPSGESTKAYSLLARTLEQTERVGIGTFVMRGHEYLVAILGEAGVLRAETLRYADELRTATDVGVSNPETAPSKARVQAMTDAIGKLTRKEIDSTELQDEYAASLRDLAQAKAKRGDGVVEAQSGDESEPDEEDGRVIDLMKLLKERLSSKAEVTTADEADASSTAKKPKKSGESSAKGPDLSTLSKNELYEKAQALDIPGRSKMAKDDLVQAIRAAS